MDMAIENIIMNPKERILKNLNDSQKAVASSIKGNLMVSAAPGSGKTATVIARTAYMIEDGVSPSSILLFTFTKKAANEIKERLINTIGERAEGVTVSTYHSFCARILRKFAHFVGLNSAYTIIDDDDRKKIIKDIVKKYLSKYNPEEDDCYYMDNETREVVKVLSFYISKQKETMKKPSDSLIDARAKDAARKLKENTPLAEMYEQYERHLLENNLVDFDNLIIFMVRIMQEHPEIRSNIASKYRYIVADEVQDSSYVDVKFIFLLGEENGNMCLVGDPDQSIYRFRGANTDFLYKTIDRNGTFKFYALGQNYRSTSNIVNAYASLITKNKRRDNSKAFTKNEEGTKIMCYECENTYAEAQYIRDMIIRTMSLIKTKTDEKWSLSDFAVLCRNTFQTRVIEDVFIKNSIQYEMVSGLSFYSRKEIKDILSYMYFFYNPKNLVALERIINVPKRRIGDKSYNSLKEQVLQKIGAYGIIDLNKMLSILGECKLTGSAAKGLKSFISDIKKIQNKYNDFVVDISNDANVNNVGDFIGNIISIISYKEYLATLGESDDKTDDRIKNLSELKTTASTYESIDDFIENMMLLDNTKDKNQSTENSVKIMTMHGSKGLEFNTVFVIGACQGIIPSYRCKTDEDTEEERRLFYVAMSRAKKLLFITTPKSIVRNGEYQILSPSQFLKEIDSSFIYKYSNKKAS